MLDILTNPAVIASAISGAVVVFVVAWKGLRRTVRVIAAVYKELNGDDNGNASLRKIVLDISERQLEMIEQQSRTAQKRSLQMDDVIDVVERLKKDLGAGKRALTAQIEQHSRDVNGRLDHHEQRIIGIEKRLPQ